MRDDESEDTGIYDNLPQFYLDEALKNLEEDKKHLETKVEELSAQINEIKKENVKLAAKVKALGRNISCLYKTALRELERKEQIIADLRKERDDLIFRRGMKDVQPSETKRSSRKQLTPTKRVRNGNIKRPDSKIKTNLSKEEGSSPFAKVLKAFEPVKKDITEKCVQPEKIVPAEKCVQTEKRVEAEKCVQPEQFVPVEKCEQVEKRVRTEKCVQPEKFAQPEKCVQPEKFVQAEKCLETEKCVQPEKFAQPEKCVQTEKRVIAEICVQPEQFVPAEKCVQVEKRVQTEKCVQPEKSETEVITPITENTTKEILKADCESKEEAVTDISCSEKTPANISIIQILSGSEDSIVKTPSTEKFTAHSSSEDCGFGRRRKIKRVIKGTSLLTSSTPISSPAGEVNHTSDEQPIAAKRICLERDVSFGILNYSAAKILDANSALRSGVDSKNSNVSKEESASEFSQGKSAAVTSKCSSAKCSDDLSTEIDKQVGVNKNKKKPQQIVNDPKTDVNSHSHCVVSESCEFDLKLSLMDDKSINLENFVQGPSDCSTPMPITQTTIELKTKTSTIVEEYNISPIEFDVKENRPSSSIGSSTPNSLESDKVPLGDRSPDESRRKRSRSWERERVIRHDSPVQNQDYGRRTRHSERDSYRERNRREPYHSKDYRSSRASNSYGDDRMRRSDREQELDGGRDPRGDRNYRSRNRDRSDNRYRNSEQVRHRDNDGMRDSGKYQRQLNSDRRNNDSLHRTSSNRNHRHEGWSGRYNKDGSRTEVEEGEWNRSRSRSKPDYRNQKENSPKVTSSRIDDLPKENCIPPTEWD